MLSAGAGRGGGRARAHLAARLLARRRRRSATRSAAASAGSGRQYGFACNRVTGDRARHRRRASRARVDADDDPDLFWALRGGGGGYAVVTALHLALLPIAEVYAGILIFPAELGADGDPRLPRLGRDRAARRSPRSSACCGRRRSPTCRSRCAAVPLITIDAACIGDRESGERAIAPLLAARRADHEQLRPDAGRRPLPHPHGPRAAGPRPRPPRPDRRAARRGDRRLRRQRPRARDRLARCCWPSCASSAAPSPAAAEGAGALDKLDAPFVMEAIGAPMAPDAGETIARATSTSLDEAMAPWPRRTAATSTSPSAPATSTRSSPPRPAPAWPRSSAAGTPTARSSPTTRSRSARPPEAIAGD